MPRVKGREDDEGAAATSLYGVYSSVVTNIEDPEKLGQVEVQLPRSRGIRAGATSWARVATLMAGNNRGTWFIPEVGDEVLIAFQAGDPRQPYVVGSLWNGDDRPPRSMDAAGDNNLRVLRTRSGLELIFDDTEGSERITLETPTGQKLVLRDDAPQVEISDASGNQITLEPSGVTVEAPDKVTIQASTVEVSASIIDLQSALVKCDGTLQAKTVITDSIDAKTYTPGAGNIW